MDPRPSFDQEWPTAARSGGQRRLTVVFASRYVRRWDVTGSPNPDSYDLADTLRMRLAESSRPASSHVETELQQLAARRLEARPSCPSGAPSAGATNGRERRSARSTRPRASPSTRTPRSQERPASFARRTASAAPSVHGSPCRSAPGPPGAARARRATGAPAPSPVQTVGRRICGPPGRSAGSAWRAHRRSSAPAVLERSRSTPPYDRARAPRAA